MHSQCSRWILATFGINSPVITPWRKKSLSLHEMARCHSGGTENVIVIKYWQIHPTSENFNIKTRRPSWHFRKPSRAANCCLLSTTTSSIVSPGLHSIDSSSKLHGLGPSGSHENHEEKDLAVYHAKKFGQWKYPGQPCGGSVRVPAMWGTGSLCYDDCLSLITTFSWDFLDKTFRFCPAKKPCQGFGDDSRDWHQQRQFEVSTSTGAAGSGRESLGALHYVVGCF